MQASPEQQSRRNARRVLIPAAVLFVVVVIPALLYVSSVPAVCSSCHRRQAGELAATTHSPSRCYACHLADGGWGFAAQKAAEFGRMYPKALFGTGMRGPARQVSADNCLSCHSDVLDATTTSNGIRINHAICARGGTCDDCHSTIAHPKSVRWQSSALMESCTECHRTQGISNECGQCHADGEPAAGSKRGPWQVTHGPNWKKTHGMGDKDSCGTCHPPDFCERCHTVPVPHPIDFGGTHGQFAKNDPGACGTCHERETFCEPCHKIEMPHPGQFIRTHTKVAVGTEDRSCLRCHIRSDCATCHEGHTHPGGAKGVPVPWSSSDESLRP